MSIKPSKSREGNFAELSNKTTLRWLESCLASARHRREERPISLLEIVRAEIIFEIEFANRRNRYLAEPTGENGRQKLEEI